MLPTGGNGGASTNAGILQFEDDLGAVANYGSNSVTQLVRYDDFIGHWAVRSPLATGCMNPDSVALTEEHLFVVGTNCAESHAWPSGYVDGTVVESHRSFGGADRGRQDLGGCHPVGSGHLYQLPLTPYGALSGTYTPVTLPADARLSPARGGVLGRHSGIHSRPQCGQLRDREQGPAVYPMPGRRRLSSSQRPLLGGERAGERVVYGKFSRACYLHILQRRPRRGVLQIDTLAGGAPTDITVSRDGKWLAVIYVAASGEGYIGVFSIDAYGDLTPVATSSPIGSPPSAEWRSANSFRGFVCENE